MIYKHCFTKIFETGKFQILPRLGLSGEHTSPSESLALLNKTTCPFRSSRSLWVVGVFGPARDAFGLLWWWWWEDDDEDCCVLLKIKK